MKNVCFLESDGFDGQVRGPSDSFDGQVKNSENPIFTNPTFN